MAEKRMMLAFALVTSTATVAGFNGMVTPKIVEAKMFMTNNSCLRLTFHAPNTVHWYIECAPLQAGQTSMCHFSFI